MHRSEETSPLTDYIYIDRHRLSSYVEQIAGPRFLERISSWEVGLNITGPQVKGQQLRNPRPFTDHEMIKILLKYLEENDLISDRRPNNHHDADPHFVLEDMTAVKVILPTTGKRSLPELKEIAVWISDPPAKALDGSRYGEGTFLYLIEAYWKSDGPYQSTFSGYSALAWLANELIKTKVISPVAAKKLGLTGKDPLGWLTPGRSLIPQNPFYLSESDKGRDKRTSDPKRDVFDRHFRHLHPTAIFEQLGAMIQSPRRIRSLYRKRYITDEREFENETGYHRSNDLVAYPIFISTI